MEADRLRRPNRNNDLYVIGAAQPQQASAHELSRGRHQSLLATSLA
jgi:hypothetical protein